jgi:ABC-type uncharacterized transport system substrate-binding protein
MLDMKRREFIALLGAGGLLLAVKVRRARAQQASMPVIGFVDARSPDAMGDRLRAFRQGLKEVGFVEDENVKVVYRWAEGKYDQLPALAADLVRRPVNVIATGGGVAPAAAAKAATTTIPIVFAIPQDPVGIGLVASLARPGGNLTGVNFFTTELAAKRLEFFRELVPGLARVAVLVNPANPNTEPTLKDVETAARSMSLQLQVFNASSRQDIDAVFATLVRERPDGVFIGGDSFFISRRVQLANLTVRHAIPATFSQREYVEIGGLMSYGANISDAYRQVGIYAGRILTARSQPTSRSSSPRSSSLSSTLRRPGCSASPCQTNCSLPPTR